MKKSWTRLLCFVVLAFPLSLAAQSFGRTKVNYKEFPFEVLETPRFEIYHYQPDSARMAMWASDIEHWYTLHQKVLLDTLSEKNPVIIYANHADFQQTRTISGSIGVGTGGVTEALKNRVIIPFAFTNQQTHHVLGHELVHAFQYDMVIRGDSTSLNNLQYLPLWMVEGMAEYLSIGRVDAHTAMWMRDAYLRDSFPDFRKLDNYSEYFPYRYGQLFWAYMTGKYGDDIMAPLFMATARYGFKAAIDTVLHVQEKVLSEQWRLDLKTYYGQLLQKREAPPPGRKLIDENNAGEMNVSPALSPDGRYLVFFTEKDLFSVSLYLADARTGRILRRIGSAAKDRQIDDFQFMESSGAWSPDSRRFALVAFSKGRNIIVIKDVFTGKTVESFAIRGLPALSNPTWSPDGGRIVFSGLVNGQTDLYAVELSSKEVVRLTDDCYSELHPSWSPDGRSIVFATDQHSYETGRTNGKWVFNLATLDVASRVIESYDVFPGANNLNPFFDRRGDIVFLSDRDGFRNIYRYDPAAGKVYQLTDLPSGVSGITMYAPAISVGSRGERLTYTHYYDKKYVIYTARMDELPNREVDPTVVDPHAAVIYPIKDNLRDVVLGNMKKLDDMSELPDTAMVRKPYRPKFQLDYVGGGGGVGVGTGATYGTVGYGSGGVELLFSDMLGYNQLYTGLYLNGEIYDFAGVVAYMNQKNRMPWGVSLTHYPYRSVMAYFPEIVDIDDQYQALLYSYDIVRMFEDRGDVYAYWPFSTTLRLEAGGAAARYSYRIDRYYNYYDALGYLFYMDREKLDAPPGFNLYQVNVALVGDNSYFGLASPMAGHRFRVGIDQYFGGWRFHSLIADLRKYYWLRPVSFAGRVIYFGRLGREADHLYPMYVGDPYLVRGYGYKQERLMALGLDYAQLSGTQIAVANVEVRLPFTGPKQIAVIPSRMLFSELALFLDGGAAWYDLDDFKSTVAGEPVMAHEVIVSTGISWRVNLFGAAVLETFYAVPLRENRQGMWGFNLLMGGW